MKYIIFPLLLFCFVASQAQTKFQSLNFIYDIQGQFILSGQHNDQKNLECGSSGSTGATYWTDQVYNITGKYPALYGADFLFHGSNQLRWDITYEAERQWNAGAVVNIMWHSCPPTLGASCGWNPGIIGSLNADQWADLLNENGVLHAVWESRIDEIAIYLQYLQEAGVEVFWRPYHEQNQTAFWWNSLGAENTKALWRMMHDYMTNELGLTNLIWVWDIQDIGGSTNFWDWDPGSTYWDVLALDIYSDAYWNSEYYNNMKIAAGGKPIAIGECFNLPSESTINTYPDYTFFMNWAYGLKKGLSCENTNSDDFIREVYNNPKVITRDEMPGWGADVPMNILAHKPVSVSSTEEGPNTMEHVNDLRYATRWSSLYEDPQWIAINLEGLFQIDSLKITWETAFATDFEIQCSMDGVAWSVIESITSNESETSVFKLNATTKHLRIYGTQRATNYGYSIYEIEGYGTRISEPFEGEAQVIPGIIEAENYDLGGEGVAYHELTAGNKFNQYRNDDVDIEICEDLNGGFSIGDIMASESLSYTVNILDEDVYDFTFRVASPVDEGQMHWEIDGIDLFNAIEVVSTGGWQNWSDLKIIGIELPEGEHKLVMTATKGDFNLNYVSVDYSSITSSSNGLDMNFSVYPNPVDDLLHLESKNSDFQISICDLQGAEIFQLPLVSSSSIDLSFLNSGIYLLTISTKDKIYRQQFSKR